MQAADGSVDDTDSKDGVRGVAHLEGQCSCGQHLGGVPHGLAVNGADLAGEFTEFFVQITALLVRVGGVDRLHRQFTHALEHISLLDHSAFSRLQQVDTVVRIANCLIQATDLRSQGSSDGQASRIVLGGVDAGACGELLHGTVEGPGIDCQGILSFQCTDVRVDCGHGLLQ